jgi:carbon storage regulator
MLVLGRKPGERVYVGDDIEVIVLEVRGGRVKLGFTAPGYLPIQRGELHRHEESWFPALEEAECA